MNSTLYFEMFQRRETSQLQCKNYNDSQNLFYKVVCSPEVSLDKICHLPHKSSKTKYLKI